ncbi:MAG: diacylglycerol/lipid kinase family protein [Candidatus Acidiferrales bacterium]
MHRHGKTLLLINPVAGGGRARRSAPHVTALLRKHGIHLGVAESRDAQDVRAHAAGAAAAGFRNVAVLGGDGTLHHAVNAALQTGVNFAFFPAGNGNDMARGLGIPLDPIAAAYAFVRGHPRPVDLLRARFACGETAHVLSACGVGLDGQAARLAATRFRRLPGAMRYVVAALYALVGFKPLQMEVEWGEGNCFGPLPLAAVANGPSYGAGIRIEPAARMDDGLLNVVLVQPLPVTRVLEAIPILLRDGNLRWPEIRRIRTRRVRLTPRDGSAAFHGDGELSGTPPVEIEVAPAATRFIY